MAQIIASSKQSIMNLPSELRNRIYEFALPKSVLIYSRLHPDGRNRIYIKEPSLLVVCKQIREETRKVIYGHVSFETDSYQRLWTFIDKIDTDRLCMLRNVRLLSATARLRNRHIALKALNQRRWDGLRPDAVKVLLEVRGQGSVDVKAVTLEEVADYEERLFYGKGPHVEYSIVRKDWEGRD